MPVTCSDQSNEASGGIPEASDSDRNIGIKLSCGFIFAVNLMLHQPLPNHGFPAFPFSLMSYSVLVMVQVKRNENKFLK